MNHARSIIDRHIRYTINIRKRGSIAQGRDGAIMRRLSCTRADIKQILLQRMSRRFLTGVCTLGLTTQAGSFIVIFITILGGNSHLP